MPLKVSPLVVVTETISPFASIRECQSICCNLRRREAGRAVAVDCSSLTGNEPLGVVADDEESDLLSFGLVVAVGGLETVSVMLSVAMMLI